MTNDKIAIVWIIINVAIWGYRWHSIPFLREEIMFYMLVIFNVVSLLLVLWRIW